MDKIIEIKLITSSDQLRFDFKTWQLLKNHQFIPLGQYGDEAFLARLLVDDRILVTSKDGLGVTLRNVPTIFDKDLYTIYIESRLQADDLKLEYSKYGLIEDIRSSHGFCFITFSTKQAAIDAVNSSKWKPFGTNPFLNEARVISKIDWNDLMSEYYSKINKVQTIEALNGYRKAEYTGGVIVKYSGMHPDTSSKTLKKLFEMVAPVAFVEHHSYFGYCRFKTPNGAQCAINYYSHIRIIQQSEYDCVGTLDTCSHGKCISMRMLNKEEEYEYWEKISNLQHEKYYANHIVEEGMVVEQADTGHHLHFEDINRPTDINAPLKTTHIRFDDIQKSKRKHAEP